MITITRRQARRLRAVFRRHPLGIAHKGTVPPLVLGADPSVGLRVRFHHAPLAVECLLPGGDRPERAIAVPLDALADFEGKEDTTVALETTATGRTVARWDDRGIPQTREYAVPEPDSLPSFPEPPTAFEAGPTGLLDALVAAVETTADDSTRYALNCLQLRGDAREVVATDGRQILIQSGFGFPWAGDLLVRATPLFASKELPRDRPVAVGKSDSHVVLRAGTWTVFLTIQADARFPRIEHIIPDGRFAATRLRLDAQDASFLRQALDRLPGGEEPNAPVTVDCNGRVAVRARAEGQDRVTELVLARSGYAGAPVRLNTSRRFLARALGLGFAEVCVTGPEDPVLCRAHGTTYLWQPLSKEAALAPSDDAIRIESATPGPITGPIEPPKEEITVNEPVPRALPDAAPDGPRNGTGVGNGAGVTGLVTLIQEAEALHDVLVDAKARTHRLIGALRRERKRSRLVASTLSALRQIRFQEAVE